GTWITEMRVFLYESITGGMLAGGPLPASLAREGDLMISALAEDFLRLPDIEIIMTRDRRLSAVPGATRTFWVDSREAFQQAWSRACTLSSAVWPVAPETDGELEKVCLEVERRQRLLLAPDAA